MRIVFYCIIIMFGFFVEATAQNLVSNPGFEEKFGCPDRNGDIKKCSFWSSTAPGSSPDYFHTCFKPIKYNSALLGVPKNSEGTREPIAGNAYTGLALFFKKNFTIREYLQNKLVSPLEKGITYTVSFYISLSDSSEFTSDHIAVSFLTNSNSIMANPPEALLTAKHLVTIKNSEALNSRKWTKVQADYAAEGGEEYIVIGSFLENMTEKEFKKKMKNPVLDCKNNECAAYYYIDEVSIVPAEKMNPRFK
jgi:OOP family OmpA-OmpF porin